MRKMLLAFGVAGIAFVASPAMADNNVTVTSLKTPPVPPTNQWGVLPGDQSAGSIAELSATNVSDTDGSLHIAGDTVRVQTGIQYSGGIYPTNTGIAANNLVSMTADFIIASLGSNDDASPAFRVYIQDGTKRSELIWEAANQVGYTGNNLGLVGNLSSMGANDLLWQYVGGSGATLNGSGGYVLHTLAEWVDLLGGNYSSSAYVSGFSIGVGSGAGTGFDAYVDNFVVNTKNPLNTNRYNFAAVPEPATWAMMLLGFGGIGASMRRQRRTIKLAQLA